MNSRRYQVVCIALILLCLVLVLLPRTGEGRNRTVYEVRPEVTVPAYRTDAARAIDAYENLMQRYMDLNEKTLLTVNTDIRAIAQRLDSIDGALVDLARRFARIEQVLGIPPEKPAPVDPNTPVQAAAPKPVQR
ncbi:MAG TPA: hypothetical protein ENN81_11885 [Phycisphaerales bacterium]|nr:hypothetical protein [Phycisphaerales bacterium]